MKFRHATLVAVSLAGSVGARPAAAQEVIDEGTLLVHRGDTPVGRETFVITGSSTGFQMTATAHYPPRRPRAIHTSTVQWGLDSLPVEARFEATGQGPKVFARFGPRRVTIRVASPRGESAREYPAAPRTLVVDDSLFALYAILPGTESGPIRVAAPRGPHVSDFELVDGGLDTTTVDGRRLGLRHFVLTAGPDTRHLWYDEAGRLAKVELPSDDIIAIRVPPTR